MIEFGITDKFYEDLKKYKTLFKKSIEDFVVDSIRVHLCEWEKDIEIYTNTRVLASSQPDRNLIIKLPDDVLDTLGQFMEYHEQSEQYIIQTMVESTITFLNLNWSGYYSLEDKELNNDEKIKELYRVNNNNEGECWNKFFN